MSWLIVPVPVTATLKTGGARPSKRRSQASVLAATRRPSASKLNVHLSELSGGVMRGDLDR